MLCLCLRVFGWQLDSANGFQRPQGHGQITRRIAPLDMVSVNGLIQTLQFLDLGLQAFHLFPLQVIETLLRLLQALPQIVVRVDCIELPPHFFLGI